LKIAHLVRRFDRVVSFVEYADHGIMLASVKLRVADYVILLAVLQATEWQRVID
jgi:hypothetical protein